MTVPATVVNTSALPRVIGCDVGKAAVTVFDTLTGQTAAIANHPEALTAFAESLPRDGLVVCEATGGYEAALLVATAAAGVPAHRADARKVKAFIRSLGRIAKTDAIDARALARYGQERHAELARWRPAGGGLDELRTLTRLRSQLSSSAPRSPTSSRPPAARSPRTAGRRCATPPPTRSPASKPISPR